MAWQRLPSLESSALDTERLAVHGGLHQLQRGGMSEYSDPNGLPPMNIVDGVSLSLTSPVPARRELTYQLSGHLLLALTHDGSVDGYVLGVYPLFSIAPGLLSTTPRCLLALPMGRTDAICFDTNAGSGVVGSQAALFRPAQHMRLRWLEHCGSLHLCIESNLSRLHDLILSCGRKWKDACKVVLPKLSLMQTLLASYEMQMTPIEFCYTITACGLWHPAAATAFSQHWNDQGIQRLRAAVDASSRSVVKLLQTKALPMVTNSLLCARYDTSIFTSL